MDIKREAVEGVNEIVRCQSVIAVNTEISLQISWHVTQHPDVVTKVSDKPAASVIYHEDESSNSSETSVFIYRTTWGSTQQIIYSEILLYEDFDDEVEGNVML